MSPPERNTTFVVDDDDDDFDGGVQYSFAVEYNGSPPAYDLPQAAPITVEVIPVAAVAAEQVAFSETLSLPVVQPLLTAEHHRSSRFSDELKTHASEQTVSPTSVIDGAAHRNDACEVSGDLSSSISSGELSDSLWRSSGAVRNSNESVLSSDYPLSYLKNHSSKNRPECVDDDDDDVRQENVVNCNMDLDNEDNLGNEFEFEFEHEQTGKVPFKREPLTKGKKGSCYRCFKGNRFMEKEVCIVCNAKYCGNCVLRAMGSMPEGRKCVTCIGYPIDESKRASLGKCSRMLKRLLNELEVRQIMKAERFCEVNQLPPEYVCVNGKRLCFEELVTLQNCANPPTKLKPGNYWYDKVSGLWGKEGQKPSRVITAHLNVGGPIKSDASNGNTQVFFNGREITKVELRMLQLAGVQCAGITHFWVNEDGSYQEEGQKNTRGYLWGKAGPKLACACLSLPIPSRSSNVYGEQPCNLVSRTAPDYLEHGIVQKFLLVGYGGSGTSTIFKQAKILYKNIPFSKDERENIKLTIQTNVYTYLGILLEVRERFEEESLGILKKSQSSKPETAGVIPKLDGKTIYSIGTRLKAFSDWLLKTIASGKLDAIFPAATHEYAPLIEELWNATAIKATYERRSEIEMLPSVASYFLERAVEILRHDYEPSDQDILYAEGVTSSNGLACAEFSFPHSAPEETVNTADFHDSLARYQLLTVHARGLGENCKWLEMFEDVGMVIFCVALSDYDQFSVDGNDCLANKMILSRKFFETIVSHPTFEQMDFLLILNKLDQFEEKIEHVPLTQCDWFSDFRPMISRHRTGSNNMNYNPSLSQLASHYVGVKFKRLYSSLTGRKLYVSVVKGLEPDSVDATLKYAKEILKWNQERPNFSLSDNDNSVFSTEASSFSL